MNCCFQGDIICGDFNAHNPIWGSNLLNKRGEVLEELFLQSECVIINNGQGTCICSPTEDSPLDLTFIDKTFAHLATWIVHDDEWGSDHYPIFTHLGISPIHEETRVQRWNLATAKWGRFTHLCTENISNIDDVDIDKFHDSIISFIKKFSKFKYSSNLK